MSEAKSELDDAVKDAPVPAHIRALPLYVPGRSEQSVAREYGLARIIKLASNENPLGCSPHVAQALVEQFSGADTALARYPDSDAFDLRNALGRYHGVPANHIAVTNGSHELIDLYRGPLFTVRISGLSDQHQGARRYRNRSAGVQLPSRSCRDARGVDRHDAPRLHLQPQQSNGYAVVSGGDRSHSGFGGSGYTRGAR
jgi:hypothetical protein